MCVCLFLSFRKKKPSEKEVISNLWRGQDFNSKQIWLKNPHILFFSKISHKLLLPSSQLLHNQASKKNSPSHIHSSNCGFSPSVDTTPLNLFSNLNRYFPILTSCELSSVACCCLLWIPFFLLLLWGHNLPSFLLPFWLLLLSCLCHFLSLSFIFVYLCGLLIFQWYYLKCDKKYIE